jgi:hypothetical protein
VDRRTGEALTCFIDGTAMREWNGTNHSDAMFARRPDGLSSCRVPYDATRR